MTDTPVDAKRTPEQLLVLAGYRYALSLTHHEQDAEDLVQHACLRVFRAKRRLEDKAYLLTTIRNLFCDVCRRRQVMSFGELAEESVVDQRPDQTRIVEGRLDVATVLATLSSSEREVMYLNCVESLTAAEISAITGQPRGTAGPANE